MFAQTRPAFKQERVFQRANELAKSLLMTLGKHTITGMLSAGGNQFEDWSAAYRLFEMERIDQKSLFAPVISNVSDCLGEYEPLNIMIDDTLARKRGHKVSGTGWKRDPLGPAFRANIVWSQRYLEISAALPDLELEGRVRGIPLDFQHAPTPVKPRKNATSEDWTEFRELQKKCKISTVGAERLAALREQVPDRKIICAADGGYTNTAMFRSIPENTVLIGRIRKDACLFKVPEKSNGTYRGRIKYYGDKMPTPEEVRQDDTIPWQQVTAFAAGKQHEFNVKTMAPVRWKCTGERDVIVVIIQPLAYRPRKGSKLLYRQPAYLICTDVHMSLDQLLQSYLWRWEIEVNIRDEKTIMGVGEAQVRTEESVQSVPAFVVACYAYLLLAAHFVKVNADCLLPPKWQHHKPTDRCSTQKILSICRAELWGFSEVLNKTGFVTDSSKSRTPFYSLQSLVSAICYATK